MYHDKENAFLSPTIKPTTKPSQLEPWQLALFAAADLIAFEGFVQNRLYDDRTGAHCVIGAINQYHTLSWSTTDDNWCLNKLCGYLGLSDWNSIVSWNNAPERTQAEVVAALRGAAGE